MKPSKNLVVLALIVSSIFLLIALQALWLKNSYEKAYLDFQRETNGIFFSTVMALRDSMLIKNLKPLNPDSVSNGTIAFTHSIDTFNATIKSRNGYRKSSSQMQIFISSHNKGDSIQTMLRPLASRIKEGNLRGNFILSMGPDSLSIDSVKQNYKKALEAADINVALKVKHTSFIPTPIQMGHGKSPFFSSPLEEDGGKTKTLQLFSDSLYSDWVRFDPVHRYAAVLSDFRPLLIKEITPQILFSLFLTLLTAAAFITMYRSMRSQQKLMELKNDFISNITHELKTPITTVGVAIEAIKNFKGVNNPAASAEYLDIAQNELNRLSILTDKILKTAIFENKGVEFKPEPIDMKNLVEQVLASMKLVFEKQEAKVVFEKQGDDFSLMGGSAHLTSIVYNLIDNALKYGPAKPEVTLTLKAEPSHIELSVRDNGIGIPIEFRKKIFEKFFRVPTGDVHTVKGYGLGLSYVESVVNAHGGKIDVESEPGRGSSFIVTLSKG
jgi:two-component system, OmpR family, phosphate regulon sensor histidine kinase PhoR